jgi:primase-polymerase (primpol)-like protein
VEDVVYSAALLKNQNRSAKVVDSNSNVDSVNEGGGKSEYSFTREESKAMPITKESATFTYLHSPVISMRDTQVEPLARFHLRTCVAITLLLKHSD